MSVLHALKISLQLPNKQAVFRLNRISTKNSFLYLFLFHVIIGLQNGLALVKDSIIRGAFQEEFLLIFFLYPSSVVLFCLTSISLFACIGMMIRNVTKRKLVYQILWKMTVHALTYPVLLYTILSWFKVNNWYFNVLLFVTFLIILWKMIVAYPKIREK